tara:strand:- start:235 stop:1410 length:1176 start_codon:yes stop_codon:yes gene_type:complete
MLPLLLGLGGSALGGAGMLGGLGALSAGALGSGLGSFLETGDLGKGIQTGLMSYMGGKALGSLMGGGADAATQLAPGATPGSVVPTSASAAEQLAASAPPVTGGQGSGAFLRTGLNTSGSFVPSAPVAPAPTSGFGDMFSFKDPTAAMQTPGSYTGAFTGDAMPYVGGALGTTALASTDLLAPKGIDPMKEGEIRPESDAAVYDPLKPPEGYRPGIDPEFRYFDPSKSSNVYNLKAGGIASLNYAEGGEMPQANDKELISNAVDAIEGKSPSPEIALGAFVARYGEEALRDLVDRVQRGEFQANAMVEEGMVEGVGDGMDDMIPATLEGDQDVVLSDGEFIVPADVVSGIGNGSSDAGSDALYEMMDRVRKLRTGKEEQPSQVPQGEMMPA